MKKQVAVKIVNEEKINIERLEKALLFEAKFFKINLEEKENIDLLFKEENLESIIIVLIGEKTNEKFLDKIIEVSKTTKKINIIDIKSNLAKGKKEILEQKENIAVLSEYKDQSVLAFNIIYDYYNENREFFEDEKNILKLETEKYKFIMTKYESTDNKEGLLKIIDEFLLEGKKYNFKGYDELKTLILLCMICDIEDEYEHFYFVYKVICEIYGKTENEIRNLINYGLNSIKIKKEKLAVNKYLKEVNGKNLVIQAKKLSNIIKEKNKMDM